jgi:hypothetical protein
MKERYRLADVPDFARKPGNGDGVCDGDRRAGGR